MQNAYLPLEMIVKLLELVSKPFVFVYTKEYVQFNTCRKWGC